jgi:hypothetical protein
MLDLSLSAHDLTGLHSPLRIRLFMERQRDISKFHQVLGDEHLA